MNHNLKLNDDAATDVAQALADITMSVASARARIDAAMPGVSEREFDRRYAEIRAALGTIADAQWRIDQIVFHTSATDSEYALPVVESLSDQCPPAGILRTVDPELEALLDEEDRIVQRDLLLARLDRGVITIQEFHAGLHIHNIVQTHPCDQWGCEHTVLFDDEPYCYTHSPDSGSSARGYSWMRANITRQVPG